ncbi:uncharacterized protein [Hyperolius riggenbachi]|uniref:uncharacterized protein n=1 Tax=Hyperolius riggenbachi TaxID=752182 RepID=UPI0035A2B850
MSGHRLTVGIFSRDGKENCTWLINLLRSPMFQSLVEYVLNVYITDDPRLFTNAITQCTFAILYHTKKRGSLNIANVPNSLYNDELRDLSEELGESVVVLVDDLEDSSDGTKRRLLMEQPLIEQCASDLILISKSEKQAANLVGTDPRWCPSPTSPALQDAHDSMHNKVYRLRNLMEDSSGINADSRARHDSYSESESRSQGYKSSVSFKSSGYRQGDLESIRSSSAYSSEHSNRSLIPSERHLDHEEIPEQLVRIPLQSDIPVVEGNLEAQKKKQKTSRYRVPFIGGKKLSDKMVFFIIGGLVGLLLIILIIILCVTL